MVERVLSDDIIDILSDKEMETDILTEEEKIGNYKNLLSSGDTIHKATEQLCLNDLKHYDGELRNLENLLENLPLNLMKR